MKLDNYVFDQKTKTAMFSFSNVTIHDINILKESYGKKNEKRKLPEDALAMMEELGMSEN